MGCTRTTVLRLTALLLALPLLFVSERPATALAREKAELAWNVDATTYLHYAVETQAAAGEEADPKPNLQHVHLMGYEIGPDGALVELSRPWVFEEMLFQLGAALPGASARAEDSWKREWNFDSVSGTQQLEVSSSYLFKQVAGYSGHECAHIVGTHKLKAERAGDNPPRWTKFELTTDAFFDGEAGYLLGMKLALRGSKLEPAPEADKEPVARNYLWDIEWKLKPPVDTTETEQIKKKVDVAIARGVERLWAQRNKEGHWPYGKHQRGGTALALLALLIGVSPWVPGDPFHLLFARVLPYRAMFYLGLTLPALAAFGADWLLGIVERRFWWQPPSALAQAAGPLFFGAFVLLVFVDFHPVSGTYTSTPRYFTAEEYEAYAWLAAKQTSGPWRIWEPTDDITLKYQRTLAPTFAPVPRYDGHWDEGVPLPMWSLRHEATDLLDPDLLNALAVRYIVLRPAEPGAERWQTELAAAGFNSLAWERGGVQIWENPATLPFAWSAGTVRALSYRPGRIRLVVEHEIAGPVRVAEAWFPDWQVTVDGQPARLLRADEAFLGVEIPPGRHEVVFFWQTPAVIWLSWALAGFALAGLIGGGVYTWIQRRRSSFR
ncbi:MAG TPA: hypothetical protein DEP84_33515 [Chloroflexi bacterium]|nr:hypothetical protein [Chloroflexota bacterium]